MRNATILGDFTKNKYTNTCSVCCFPVFLLHSHRCVVFCRFNPPVNNWTNTGTEKGLTSELLMKQDVPVKGFVVNN